MDKVASRLAAKIATLPDATVAVVDFTDLQGRVTELGRYYAEELSIALVNAPGGFKVIDRGHLKALLAEHKFQTSGVVDEKTAAELGRIAGVNILITGTVTEIEGSLRLAVKALNTKSAAIQAAVSVSMGKSDATSALSRRDVTNVTSGGAASGVAARTPGALNVRMFQNDFLIATVESASIRKEGSEVNAYISFTIENKSSREEYIGAQKGSGTPDICEAILMDTSGINWGSYGSITGIMAAPARWGRGRQSYTRIAPGERQTVVVKFRSRSDRTSSLLASTASLSINMLRFRENTPDEGQPFNIGFSGIPLGK